MNSKKKKASKKPRVGTDRNTPLADVEERSKPYDEVGLTNEEIRHQNQGELHQEPSPGVGPVPTDGS